MQGPLSNSLVNTSPGLGRIDQYVYITTEYANPYTFALPLPPLCSWGRERPAGPEWGEDRSQPSCRGRAARDLASFLPLRQLVGALTPRHCPAPGPWLSAPWRAITPERPCSSSPRGMAGGCGAVGRVMCMLHPTQQPLAATQRAPLGRAMCGRPLEARGSGGPN